jgi:coenzyme F420-0:L-glutamate ligase / coenzyme F420-1:gamma-L-glutamate ligase
VDALTIFALPGIPLIQEGDDLVAVILASLERAGVSLQNGDALVISSKIVSKSEGRFVDLETVIPTEEAEQLAEETRKDPRIVEMALRESVRVSRKSMGVLVTQHNLGFVSAMSGIDQSNVGLGDDVILLLPEDPDKSAAQLRQRLKEQTGADVAVVISDTHGRPFRMGNVGVAIGVSGMPALLDLRGQQDLFGRTLRITQSGYGDMVASAAHLLCGEGAEGLPIIFMRGLNFEKIEGRANDLNRPPEMDLYR